jgi:hypothetical protein
MNTGLVFAPFVFVAWPLRGHGIDANLGVSALKISKTAKGELSGCRPMNEGARYRRPNRS